MKKYELTDETKEFDGKILYRIRALIDFGLVKAGDFGGWIGGYSEFVAKFRPNRFGCWCLP